MRSLHLLSREHSGLLIVDLQEKLLSVIPGSSRIVWNTTRLIRAAAAMGVTHSATLQYPHGLGPMSLSLINYFPSPHEKLRFSAVIEPIVTWCREANLSQVVVCGIETHICIQQTAMDLMAAGYDVYVPADAVASRNELDHCTALRRLDACGATITTVESVLFEWCESAADPAFKQISALVREEFSS